MYLYVQSGCDAADVHTWAVHVTSSGRFWYANIPYFFCLAWGLYKLLCDSCCQGKCLRQCSKAVLWFAMITCSLYHWLLRAQSVILAVACNAYVFWLGSTGHLWSYSRSLLGVCCLSLPFPFTTLCNTGTPSQPWIGRSGSGWKGVVSRVRVTHKWCNARVTASNMRQVVW